MGSVQHGHRWWLALTVMLMGWLVLPENAEASPVSVGIVVIEASRSGKTIDPRVKGLKLDKKLGQLGFKSAKVMDELNAKVELGAQISLEILKKTGKPKMLKVKVLEANRKTGTVKLNVAVPELEFDTQTTHKKGGTLMLTIPSGKAKRLFMAVSPKL